ncbi:MAG TPA: hypothetical protein VNZ03_13860 [Terriglobales bacterium]|nr:hypothetical protein [Terriglobales bacterium]
MAHFTQLGLSSHQDQKPQGKTLPNLPSGRQHPQSNVDKAGSRQKLAALIASLTTTALLGLFVLESGCSKESGKTETIAPPSQTAATQAPAQMLTTPAAVANQPPAKKKSRQRRLSASTYANPAFGVSFQYPKEDSLKEGDEASVELHNVGLLEMNFIRPGGTTISVVELPRKVYTGTDFNSAFFNVSVNPKLSAADCEQFAFAERDDPGRDSVAASKTKVGATEFHAVEGFAEEADNQADVKYYHVFQNSSCYEFALGLETVEEATTDKMKPGVKPVDRNEVFRKLRWILSTVKIQPLEKSDLQVATQTPAQPTNTEITAVH